MHLPHLKGSTFEGHARWYLGLFFFLLSFIFQLTAAPSMRDGAAGRLLATLQAKEAMIASEDVTILE